MKSTMRIRGKGFRESSDYEQGGERRKMKKYVCIIWLSLAVFLGGSMSARADHQLSLYIPSGATTENSRIYLNFTLYVHFWL